MGVTMESRNSGAPAPGRGTVSDRRRTEGGVSLRIGYQSSVAIGANPVYRPYAISIVRAAGSAAAQGYDAIAVGCYIPTCGCPEPGVQ